MKSLEEWAKVFVSRLKFLMLPPPPLLHGVVQLLVPSTPATLDSIGRNAPQATAVMDVWWNCRSAHPP